MHLQVKLKTESRPFYYSQAKLSPQSCHHPLRRDKLLILRAAKRVTLLFLDFFDLHYISLRLLVKADFKSFHELLLNY